MIRPSLASKAASSRRGRTLRSLAAVVVAGLAAPGAAAAQEAPGGRPLANAVSVSIGLFRPADGVFQSVYGGSMVPISADASRRLWRAVSVFAGARQARADGTARPMGSGAALGENAVHLSALTGCAGAAVAIMRADWVFETGAGATIGRYTERWSDEPALEAGAETDGEVRTTRIGALIRVAASRSISRRLAVVGRVEYSFVQHAPARQGEATVPRNLGGLGTTIGLLLRF
jgi:hypothetical protein